MLPSTQDSENDVWSDWLLHRRQADDPKLTNTVRTAVDTYVERVLDHAKLAPGMTLLDIGTGEGVVAFGAIERIGKSLNVILTDISPPMLDFAKAEASERNLLDQCRFVECQADDLSAIDDASVDRVTTRSVLAYVADKPRAFSEIGRVLKPGGRLSIAEPLFLDESLAAQVLANRSNSGNGNTLDIFMGLMHRWKAAQFPDTDALRSATPISNYSERDLLKMVINTGFVNTHLEMHIDVRPSTIDSWDAFIGSSPHPWAPSLKTIMSEQFTHEESRFFESVVRPSVESGVNTETDRMVYIFADKPK